MARYFPPEARISRIHGQPRYDEIRAYYPLYHPAAALRNPNLRHDMEADIKRIPEVVAEMKRRRAEGITSDERDESNDDTPDEPKEPPKQLSLF